MTRYNHITLALLLLFMPLTHIMASHPDGKNLYVQNCSVCHGDQGSGGVGVPLDLESFQNNVSDRYLFNSIKFGRPGRTMPAFESLLTDDDMKSIVQYIRHFSTGKALEFDQTPIKGNIKKGKEIYEDRCASCHGDNGLGGRGTGVTLSRPRDLNIIAPALNNAGFLKSASDEMIKHTLMHGRDKTPMNSYLKQGLSESDINNVVAYVRNFEKHLPKSTDYSKLDPIIQEESPYSLEKTLDNLKKAVLGKNFRIIREQTVDDGLVAKKQQNKKQIILYFCNFKFLNESLAIDPRIGLFLPCRITVVQHGNTVKLMAINPLRLSKMFNNSELDEACKSMTDLYTEIIEEATL